MDSSKFKFIIIAILALFVAIYLGVSAATAQFETVAWILGGLTLLTCILLGRKVWLLIPFFSALNISLMVPGNPSTLLIAQGLVIGFCSLLFLMRRLPYRFQFTELEFWGLMLTLFVAQVYFRNPVSISLFGGDTVGGKAYILYAVALVSAVLLCGLRVTTKELKWILPLSILGGLGSTAVAVVGQLVPTIGYFTGNLDAPSHNIQREAMDSRAANRIGFLGSFGTNLSLWISSYISPLRACFRPLWAILVVAAVIAAGMSGFRNTIAAVGMIFLLGIAYRSGFVGIVISLLGGVMALGLLAVVNSIHPLPPNIQRSLSFLPGTWEQRYKEDTKGSTEWRVEIWKEVLTTDRWIQNKWLGDGLGFSAAELAAQINIREGARAGVSGFDAHRDAILANGDYHSGPVSTIRVIGYIGLFFFLLAQVRLAVHAHRQIKRCRGTEWYSLALFIGIPLIYGPVFFVFIFADFKSGAAGFLLSLSLVRLLENNLPLPTHAKFRPVSVRQQLSSHVKTLA